MKYRDKLDKNKKRVKELSLALFTYAWEQRKLSELADFSKGQGYTKSDLKESGTPIILYGRLYTKYQTIIREVDTFADEISGAVFSKGGEVILPSSGETAEDIAIASSVEKSGFLLGGGLNIVFPHKEIESDFLATEISFGTPHKKLAKHAQGKSVVHLYNEDLKAVEISYPSLEEQKKISTMFDNLDTLITLHQRKCEKLQNVKKSCLEKMFPKNGESVPEIRFKGFTDAWEQRKLGDMCDEFQSGRSIKSSDITDSGKYVVYGGNGLRGYTDTYNHDGEYALIGRQGALCGNMNFSCGKAYFTEHAVAVHGNKNNDTLFLYYLLNEMNLGQYSGQSAQPGLAVNKIILLKAFAPNKAEQHQIGAYFRNLDTLITLHQRKLEKLQNIKKSCLEKMFV